MARKSNAIAGYPLLWKNHQRVYLSIFQEALSQLTVTDAQRQDEDAISEQLALLLREICFCSPDKPKLPEWERPLSPAIKEELRGGKSRKRPDFTCTLINPFAQTSEFHEVALHVECKRLGVGSKSWNLNQNYVKNGIHRFDCSDHQYGSRVSSGAMIGYIISSDPLTILDEVNTAIGEMTPLTFTGKETVESFQQRFRRTKLQPVVFCLTHIWADLRN